MKKLLTGLLLGALFVIPSAVKADTVSDLTAQINNLISVINNLKAQVPAAAGSVLGVSTTVPSGCTTNTAFDPATGLPCNSSTTTPVPVVACTALTLNMGIGATDSSTHGQVSSLQAFLRAKGYMQNGVSGYYGQATSNGVARYQAARGIKPVSGYLGATTRTAISTDTCANAIAVALPSSGSVYTTGQPMTIQWKDYTNLGDVYALYVVHANGATSYIDTTKGDPVSGSLARTYTWKTGYLKDGSLTDGIKMIRVILVTDGTVVVSGTSAQFTITNVIMATTTNVFSANIKVNDSDNPTAVPYNSLQNLSWGSTNETHCNGWGNSIQLSDGSQWTDKNNLAPSGSARFYAGLVGSPSYQGPLTLGIQCWDASGNSNVNDTVVVPVSYTTSTTTIVLDGTNGTMSVTPIPLVGPITIAKGQTKDMVAFNLLATGGLVYANRIDVHFSVRPWLYFNQVQLHDKYGNTIATKAISSAADATEITVGSDYLVRFDNVNIPVTPTTGKAVFVSGTVLTATDKLTTDTPINVFLPTGAVRTVNGIGYTDGSQPLTQILTPVTLLGSGNPNTGAAIYTQGASCDPMTGRCISSTITTSPVVTTANVLVHGAQIKAQNQNATITGLKYSLSYVQVSTTPPAGVPYFTNARLVDTTSGLIYGASSVTGGITFSNLNIPLTKDAWKTLTLMVDIPAGINNTTLGFTLLGSSITGVDSSYNTINVTTAGNVMGNNITFSTNPTNSTVNQSPKIITASAPMGSISVGQMVTLNFTASDPNQDNLSWSINWGDGSGVAGTCQSPLQAQGLGTTFAGSHAYTQAGNYTVTVSTNDCRGGSDTTTLPISVVAQAPQPTVTVLSPVGGESWTVGQQASIRWSSTGIRDANLYLHFTDGGTCFLSDQPSTDGTHLFIFVLNPNCPNIPRSVTSGQYKVLIVANADASGNPLARGESSNYFNVAGVTSNTQPTITVHSPNGGESAAIGTTLPIVVEATPGQTVTLNIISCPNTLCSSQVYTITKSLLVPGDGEGVYLWNAGSLSDGTAKIGAGQYQIQACLSNGTCDMSNDPFTLTSTPVRLSTGNILGTGNVLGVSTNVPNTLGVISSLIASLTDRLASLQSQLAQVVSAGTTIKITSVVPPVAYSGNILRTMWTDSPKLEGAYEVLLRDNAGNQYPIQWNAQPAVLNATMGYYDWKVGALPGLSPSGTYHITICHTYVAPCASTGNFTLSGVTPITVGTIYTRLATTTPIARTVQTSATSITRDVVMGVYSLKTQNQNATVSSLGFQLRPTISDVIAPILSNVRLKVDGVVYGANTISGTKVGFANMALPLVRDSWKDITLIADVAPSINNVTVSSSLTAAAIQAVDANYNQADVSHATDIVANDVHFNLNALTVNNTSASISMCAVDTSGRTTNCTMTMTFTLQNLGNSDAFIAKDPSQVLVTAVSPLTASSSLNFVITSVNPGDTSGGYVIQAQASRTFTYKGIMARPTNGGLETYSITAVRYGLTLGPSNSVTDNIGSLTVSKVF